VSKIFLSTTLTDRLRKVACATIRRALSEKQTIKVTPAVKNAKKSVPVERLKISFIKTSRDCMM